MCPVRSRAPNYRNIMKVVKPAKGVRGQIVVREDGVYFKTHDYLHSEEYKITHLNLEVVIVDEDAAFYDHEYLDHAPETIGVRVVPRPSNH